MTALLSVVKKNITNVAQAIPIPENVQRAELWYSDSGVAGNLRICFEAASALDAAHRLNFSGAHLVLASKTNFPGIALNSQTNLWVQTDSAIGGGSNNLSLLFEVSE